MGFQQIQKVTKREAGVDDVFHHEYVLVRDGHAQIVRDFDDASGLGGRTVAVHGEKIAADLSIHGAHQIRHEDERPAQDPDDMDGSRGEVGGDLAAQLGHAVGDLRGGKELTRRHGCAQAIIFQTDSSSNQVKIAWNPAAGCVVHKAGGTMTKTNPYSIRVQSWLPLIVLGFEAACAGTGQQTKTGQPGGEPAVHLDMDPIKIEATTDADGLHIDAYDAPELFEHGGVALSEKRFDDAVKVYGKLLKNFPESPYARPALYNLGLAQIGKKDWAAAIDSFKALTEKYPSHPDAKDSLFQLGACYAEQNNWPASAEVFARILDRSDLNADDRIEAIARRGFAQFNLNDLDTAEKTFRAAMTYKQRIESEERLATDFYLAFSQYHLGQIFHLRFRKAALRLPEAQLDKDLEEKAHLLLTAQRAYIDTIKFGNPAWASAAGFQVGSLYEELFDSFMSVPIPPELDTEARTVYQEELHKKIRILLEKSLRWQRENLLMIERLGVSTEWAEKSKLAYAKLLRLLDPKLPGANEESPKAAPSSPAPSPSSVPPPVPQAPFRGGESPTEAAPSSNDALRRHVL